MFEKGMLKQTFFKLISAVVLLLGSPGLRAQQHNWTYNYGIQPAFHVSALRANLADSFSSRSSAGFSTFVEAATAKDIFALAVGYSQNRFYKDEDAETHLFHSADLVMEWLRPFGGASKTSLNLGFIPSFLLLHQQKVLDGTKTSGLSVRTISLPYRVDYGFKAGLSFQLAKGVDLQLNYQEFLTSNNRDGLLKPKGDLLQIGLRLRLNQLEFKQNNYEEAAVQLSKIKDGLVVFVLNSNDTSEGMRSRKARHLPIDVQVAICDSLFSFTDKAYLNEEQLPLYLNSGNSGLFYQSAASGKGDIYIVRVGKYFLSNNDDIRSGLFLYTREMESVHYPLPGFTPYRSMGYDYDDSALFARMINEFNSALLEAERSLIPLSIPQAQPD